MVIRQLNVPGRVLIDSDSCSMQEHSYIDCFLQFGPQDVYLKAFSGMLFMFFIHLGSLWIAFSRVAL